MKTIKNKIICGILGLSAMLCIGGGISVYTQSSVVASANSNPTVNTLGVLQWAETNGAVSYKVSSAYGEFTVENNEANIGEWLTRAVKTASGDSQTLDLTITPQTVSGAGSAIEYSHTIERYIDYGYSSQDITDVYAPAKDGVTVTGTTANSAVGGAPSATYKNELLTYGITFGGTRAFSASGAGSNFFFFGKSIPTPSAKYWAWRITETGTKFQIKVSDSDTKSPSGTVVYEASVVSPAVGDTLLYSVGIFDTYALSSGDKIGETMYVRRDKLSASGVKTLYDEHSQFVSTADLEAYGVTEEDYVSLGTGNYMQNAKMDNAVFGWWPNSSSVSWTIRSGRADGALKQPNMLYYDNVDESVVWNKVKGATAYEWACGNDAWQTVNTTRVCVSELLAAYQENYATTGIHYLPIRVRAKNSENVSETACYNINLKTFFKRKSTLLDYSSVNNNLLTTGKYSADNYAENVASAEFGMGTHLTYAIEFMEGTENKIFAMGLFAKNVLKNNYGPYYCLRIDQSGQLLFSRSVNNSVYNRVWRSAKLDGLEAGTRYYVQYGIDEVYAITDRTKKVAERATIILRKEVGFDREIIARVIFDNYQWDQEDYVETDGDEVTKTKVNMLGQSNIQTYYGKISALAAEPQFMYTAPAFTQDVCDVYFVAGNTPVGNTQISYGESFNFTNILNTEVEGYDIEGWVYKDGTTEIPVENYGVWNLYGEEAVLIEAVATATEYSISYELPATPAGVINPNSNPDKYTIEDTIKLSAPENIPDGYVFDGWYLKTDVDKENEITEISNQTGDIELVASIIRGYTVTVDIDGKKETHQYLEGGEPLTLSAPAINGKTFVKWQKKVGDEYVDYIQNSVLPTENITLKAVYIYTPYQITYVAEGATHSNPATYTIETDVVLNSATKDGYFFGGWYLDEAFMQRIENTAGLTENLTVYARFIKDNLQPTATVYVSEEKQILPMPVLPEGFSFTTKMCEKGSSEAITLQDGFYYAFTELGKVYTVEYTITLPTGEKVVRNVELTVVEEVQNDVQEPAKKGVPWLMIGLIAGGVVLVGAGVGVFFYVKNKKKEND